jgi:hypothetical protein
MSHTLVRGDGISECEQRVSERYFGERSMRGDGRSVFFEFGTVCWEHYHDKINES